MPSQTNDHDSVQGGVGLAIPAAVKSMSSTGLSRTGRDGANATELREGRFGAYSVGIVPCRDQYLSGGIETHTKPLEHVGSGCVRESLELSAVDFDLFVEAKPPPR